MIHAYDYMQSDEVQGWADKNGLQTANVFTSEADGQIEEVSCQTSSVNVSVTYQIYLLEDGALTPDDGKLAATASADYDFAGYHKLKLDTPVAVSKGQKYAVVVTSCFTDGKDVYYEFSSTTAYNKEAVSEYNRKVLYRHRGDLLEDGVTAEEAYEDELISYYSVGIVNEGESYVYMNELGQWADFGQVVPCLQKADEFSEVDFDNFSIKAYLSYEGSAVENEDLVTSESNLSGDLTYAEPAGPICWSWLIKILVILAVAGCILLVVLFVLNHHQSELEKRRKDYQKQLLAKIWKLEKENRELKERLGEGALEKEEADKAGEGKAVKEEGK